MDTNSTGPYACFLCEVTGLTSFDMKQHLQAFHASACSSSAKLHFECIICDFNAESADEIRYHITAEHSEQNVCPFCDLNCADADGLSSHLSTQHMKSLVKVSNEDFESAAGHKDNTEEMFETDTESCKEENQTVASEQGESAMDFKDARASITDLDLVEDEIADTSLRLTDCPVGSGSDLIMLEQKFQVSNVTAGDFLTDVFTKETIKSDRQDQQSDAKMASNLLPVEGSCNIDCDLRTADMDEDNEHTADLNLTEDVYGGARQKYQTVTKPSTSNQQHTAVIGKSKESLGIVNKNDVPGSSTHAERQLYDCPLCPFQTNSEGQILRHFNTEHMSAEDSSASDTDYVNPLLYSCPMCCAGFDSPKDLSYHVNEKHLDKDNRDNFSQVLAHHAGSMPNMRNGHEEKSSDHLRESSKISSHSNAPLECVVCGMVMEHGDLSLLAQHVEKHFQSTHQEDLDRQFAQKLQSEERQRAEMEAHQLQQLKAVYGLDTRLTARQQFDQDLEHAVTKGKMTVSEFHERKASQARSSQSGVDDGYTQVTGIIEKLRTYYSGKAGASNISRVHLCDPLHHYSGSYGDKGWGCGYRNFQMLLSCLVTDATYLRVLFNGCPQIPSIWKLQQLLEAAWQAGFDVQGCEQLEGKVVNTRKWIGATEIVATLSSLHVKCQLLDFYAPSGQDNTHPVMINWVKDYYRKSSNFKPPLYLQHQGHSRMIVGVEEFHKGNCNLLLFDPGMHKSRMELFHSNIEYNTLRTIRKTPDAFRAPQYQIVAVVGILNDEEFQTKDLSSKSVKRFSYRPTLAQGAAKTIRSQRLG